MLKISVVMLVTAAFAGLLIYEPYETSAKSAALPTNGPPKLASATPTPAPAETVAAAEAPTQIRTQDIEEIVLKVLADRVPQEREPSGVAAMPEKPVATFAPRPLPASNGSQQPPVLQTVAHIPAAQPVSVRYEDPSVSGVDPALPVKPV